MALQDQQSTDGLKMWIHHILSREGFKVSLKRAQRRMKELGLCAITVKKYKPHSSKKISEVSENVLKRDFSTTSINEKWVGDITYIHFLYHTF